MRTSYVNMVANQVFVIWVCSNRHWHNRKLVLVVTMCIRTYSIWQQLMDITSVKIIPFLMVTNEPL